MEILLDNWWTFWWENNFIISNIFVSIIWKIILVNWWTLWWEYIDNQKYNYCKYIVIKNGNNICKKVLDKLSKR